MSAGASEDDGVLGVSPNENQVQRRQDATRARRPEPNYRKVAALRDKRLRLGLLRLRGARGIATRGVGFWLKDRDGDDRAQGRCRLLNDAPRPRLHEANSHSTCMYKFKLLPSRPCRTHVQAHGTTV